MPLLADGFSAAICSKSIVDVDVDRVKTGRPFLLHQRSTVGLFTLPAACFGSPHVAQDRVDKIGQMSRHAASDGSDVSCPRLCSGLTSWLVCTRLMMSSLWSRMRPMWAPGHRRSTADRISTTGAAEKNNGKTDVNI